MVFDDLLHLNLDSCSFRGKCDFSLIFVSGQCAWGKAMKIALFLAKWKTSEGLSHEVLADFWKMFFWSRFPTQECFWSSLACFLRCFLLHVSLSKNLFTTSASLSSPSALPIPCPRPPWRVSASADDVRRPKNVCEADEHVEVCQAVSIDLSSHFERL